MSPQDLNTCPIVRPNYKLNCVWCTVELKVIGNLECGIKFYREKKPRHFFYTIEYPYPPTNSVHALIVRDGLNDLHVLVKGDNVHGVPNLIERQMF